MRYAFILAAALTGCASSGQTFSVGDAENNEVKDIGSLEVYPTHDMGLDFGTVSTTSVGKMKGFRVSNIGDGSLMVTHVRITDAGDNVGAEVFKDLRRADGGQGTNFTLTAGQKMEFTVNASASVPMEAVGNIEVYANDTTVDFGGPGKYQLPLRIRVVAPDTPDDTGETPDTGAPTEDTSSPTTDTGR